MPMTVKDQEHGENIKSIKGFKAQIEILAPVLNAANAKLAALQAIIDSINTSAATAGEKTAIVGAINSSALISDAKAEYEGIVAEYENNITQAKSNASSLNAEINADGDLTAEQKAEFSVINDDIQGA